MTARLLTAGSLVLCLALMSAVPIYGQSDEEIAAARARGVKFLKEKQKGEGNWEFGGHDTGITALCTIALIENGVPLNDSAVQKGYEYVKKNSNKLKNTYDLSLVVVLLSRFGDRRDRPLIKSYAARLIAGPGLAVRRDEPGRRWIVALRVRIDLDCVDERLGANAGLAIARHGDSHRVPQIQRCRCDPVVGKTCVSLLARGDGHLAFGEGREPNHFLGKFLCFVACQHGISP